MAEISSARLRLRPIDLSHCRYLNHRKIKSGPRTWGSRSNAGLDLLGLGDFRLGFIFVAQRPHGETTAVQRISILRVEVDRSGVIGKCVIVPARTLVDVAAIDERLGKAAVELDRLIEVLDRAPRLSDRRIS